MLQSSTRRVLGSFFLERANLSGLVLAALIQIQIKPKKREFRRERTQGREQALFVLVVDDDLDSLEITTFALEQIGIDVVSVSSGAAALEIFNQRVPILLISDIGMPGMDGYMLIRQIRKRSKQAGGQVSAIALTAYASDQDHKKAIEAGFQTYVTKPVDPDVLTEVVRGVLA